MIISISIVVVAIIFVIVSINLDGITIWYNLLCGLAGAGIGFLIGLVLWLAISGAAISLGAPTESVLDSETPVISLTDTYNIDSECYVFRTYTNEKLQYTFMYEAEQGYSVETVNASDIYIKYTTGSPLIKTYSVHYKNPVLNFLCDPMDWGYNVLYVPEGTIQTKLKIDFE